MGAFNEWVRGSSLEDPARRRIVVVARNILHGAAVQLRARALESQGIRVPREFVRCSPLEVRELEEVSR
jgi:hypothetical protein